MGERDPFNVKYDRMGEALEKIMELSKPGQTINLTQGIDILTDIWNEAKNALKQMEE